MELHIDLYNSITATAWAIATFLIAGIAITRRK
jgi:hypothetical protein